MSVLVDTSALFALLNQADHNHRSAAAAWEQLLADEADLRTSNYIVLEGVATAQRRLGIGAARDLLLELVGAIHVHWVGPDVHEPAAVRLLVAGQRDLSLVDFVSFELMRREGIRTAFTFDRHFAEQGFECVPGMPAQGAPPRS